MRRVILISAALLTATPAMAQWEHPLAAQLLEEENCVVSFYTGLVEREVDGKPVVIVRAHCDDQRAFDATRNDAGQPFEIKECGVQAC